MDRKKVAKLAGFTGALCTTAALAGITIASTGAYFTDSKDGSINASTGSVKVSTSNTNLNFEQLLPGDFKTQEFDYSNTGTSSQDIWLVLPSGANGGADVLTDDSNGGGYGRYGHFEVNAPDGRFVSNNLRQGSGCPIDANGHGGSDQQATSTKNTDNGSYVPFCAAPHAIKLSNDLPSGGSGKASITFGYTKIAKGGQSAPLGQVATYKIVATQHGVRPDDVNNPGN